MLARLAEALPTDGVLSEGQIQRWYGLELSHVPASHPVVAIRAAHSGRSYRTHTVWMVCDSPSLIHQTDDCLRHAAGVAELRHLLGALPQNWQTYSQPSHPDAVWHSPQGPVAVEYDYGSYSPQTLRRKMADFGRQQVWGAPAATRVKRLQEALGDRGKVWLAAWW